MTNLNSFGKYVYFKRSKSVDQPSENCSSLVPAGLSRVENRDSGGARVVARQVETAVYMEGFTGNIAG